MPQAGSGLLFVSTLLVVLGGCSGTPFGEQLSRSFSTPETPAASPVAPTSETSRTEPEVAPSEPNAQARLKVQPGAPADSANRNSASADAPTFKTAPYRLTIRLPAADPSSPAELVTQALRAAGVSFEVEMIERVQNEAGSPDASAASPTPTPAPAPR